MKNLKSFFIFLSRNKLYTFINVFGLSISLMFVILIANYTINELSTDRFHKNINHIYILSEGNWVTGAHDVISKLEGKYPEIEKMCGVSGYGDTKVKVMGKSMIAANMFVDSTFFDIFSFELISGDRDKVLKTNNSVVISQSFAKEAFGDVEPLGQTINLNDSVSVVVSGVMNDFKNSMFSECYDILLPFDNAKYYNPSIFSDFYSTTIFIQTYSNADITTRKGDMLEYFKTCYDTYITGVSNKVEFIPLKNYYMSGIYPGTGHLKSGNFTIIMVLLFIGVLILVFAVMNYINLTVAQTSFRAKEMATRRLLGSSKMAIFLNMITESALICFLSFMFGMLLAVSLEPYVNDLLNVKISVFGDVTLLWGVSYFFFVLLISVISGFIPATIISRFKPIDVVKGSFKYKSKMLYSKIFIVFQNVITIVLVVCATAMLLQVRHIINADLGYNHDALLQVRTNMIGSKEKCKSFRDEINRLPCVSAVAFIQGNPLNGGNYHEMTYNDEQVDYQCITLDSVGFKILGLKKIQDNKIEGSGWWFSEFTMNFMGIPIDTTNVNIDKVNRNIAGVVKDFHTRDIEENMRPLFITFNEDMYPWEIFVKVNGDLGVAFNEIDKVYKKFSDGIPLSASYFDDDIRFGFQIEQNTSVIVMIFTIIAILISALGLLAMATYFIQQRS
ncbi:MAG: ABC transporter permease, partial [Rikenellaceae bacterium]